MQWSPLLQACCLCHLITKLNSKLTTHRDSPHRTFPQSKHPFSTFLYKHSPTEQTKYWKQVATDWWTYKARCRSTEGRCCAATPVGVMQGLGCRMKRAEMLTDTHTLPSIGCKSKAAGRRSPGHHVLSNRTATRERTGHSHWPQRLITPKITDFPSTVVSVCFFSSRHDAVYCIKKDHYNREKKTVSNFFWHWAVFFVVIVSTAAAPACGQLTRVGQWSWGPRGGSLWLGQTLILQLQPSISPSSLRSHLG